MKEILVHVLKPSKAQLLVSYAANVARVLGLSVRYLHVQSPTNFPLDLPGSIHTGDTKRDIDQETESARHHFELQFKNLQASDPDLTLMDYNIEIGNPTDVVCDYCANENVEMVMLSGSTEKALFSDDAGNVEIIRKINKPVWIVPEGITYKPFSEILYATDYHEEDIPNLKQLARFASIFPASITAVHVTNDYGFGQKVKGEGYGRMIKQETGYEMISVKVLPATKGEPLVDELHDFALKMSADLIVLLRENRHFFDRLLHGSRSEKIARVTLLPVLIFNEEKK